jgi:hypothetical protein
MSYRTVIKVQYTPIRMTPIHQENGGKWIRLYKALS